jgi:hypothetical protein
VVLLRLKVVAPKCHKLERSWEIPRRELPRHRDVLLVLLLLQVLQVGLLRLAVPMLLGSRLEWQLLPLLVKHINLLQQLFVVQSFCFCCCSCVRCRQ